MHTPLTNHKDDMIEEVTDDDEQVIAIGQPSQDTISRENAEFSDENKNLILHLLPTLKVGCDLSNVKKREYTFS